jgi:hypothetical protein
MKADTLRIVGWLFAAPWEFNFESGGLNEFGI